MHVIFGGVWSNVLAMEATAQLVPVGSDEKEDETCQGNNEDEEEAASELVSSLIIQHSCYVLTPFLVE